MTERIDHADKTREWVGSKGASRAGISDGLTIALAAIAQVHATLALVEQQRIANLLAYMALSDRVLERESDAWSEIEEGLGIA